MKTPIGIAWRNGFVRMCSDCFDKPYLISEMKRNPNNIMPVIVIDITTKKAKCYMINSSMTDFDEVTSSEPVLCRRIETIADWMINKVKVQKSNITPEEKTDLCDCYEKKYYRHLKLTTKESKTLKDLEKKMG